MKRLALLLVSFFGLKTFAGPPAVLDDLSELRWQHRLIIVNETVDQAALLTRFSEQAEQIAERNILWFLIAGDDIKTNYTGVIGDRLAGQLRSRVGLAHSGVALIGLDGSLKARSDSVDLEVLFSTIDAMPMRQRELQR